VKHPVKTICFKTWQTLLCVTESRVLRSVLQDNHSDVKEKETLSVKHRE